jgi:hypothetical protein
MERPWQAADKRCSMRGSYTRAPEGAQESAAQHLTISAGGTWHHRLGRCTCPVCERPHALLVEDGHTKPQVSCLKGCDRRVIISICRARGWLGGRDNG